ncbi:hypothetical protein BX666DRAFT_1857770 [Dichotomocladium elegans]|nr:hypothetical protein BX666DRAFT_1857770 [Dichotomocladium elegans]
MAISDHRLVFWADDRDCLVALFPLIDRFSKVQGIEIHVVYVRRLENEEVHWPSNAGVLHILSPTTSYHRKIKILDILAPRRIIHAQGSWSAERELLLVLQQQHDGPTIISLPVKEIPHALWIADLSFEALTQWNTVQIELVVITDSRPQSLGRLFQSLRRGMYLGDRVDLTIHMEQTADSVTRRATQNLVWDHGAKTVRHRIRKGGLMPAIVESWYPSSNNDYAVILEDDIEVSHLFYIWAKYAILKYRYSGDRTMDGYPSLFGVSLYSPRHLELLPEGRRPFDPSQFIDGHSPYLTPVPCSWGAVYFPEHWREFHSYLIGRLDMPSSANVTVPESRSNRWKKSWKKYFIELAYFRAYVMLYPNFNHFESFSTNHLEIGTHVKDRGRSQSKIDEFQVPLMHIDTIIAQLPQHKLPDFSALPVLDLWGKPTSLDQLNDRSLAWHPKISTCERNKANSFDPSDLLCPYPSTSKKKKAVSK